MQIWKHAQWQSFKGTWMIASVVLSDDEIKSLILANPAKYGKLESWTTI